MNDLTFHFHLLTDLRATAASLPRALERDLETLLGPDLYPCYRDLQSRYDARAQDLAAHILAAEATIRQLVLATGHTVTVGPYQAVYTPGRVTWDNRALDGYCLAHPELLAYRRQGQPTVTLRHLPDKADYS